MKATYIPTRPPEEISQAEIDTLSQIIRKIEHLSSISSETQRGLMQSQEGIAQLTQANLNNLTNITYKANQGVAPEKLAACLARYSRNNEGIDAILTLYRDKSPDQIFKFIDYGHASVGGLTGGIAIAVDKVSMLLAYKLFEFAQMADGQESSTRYIALDSSSLPTPEELGIPSGIIPLWKETTALGFELYKETSEALNKIVSENPEIARIPEKAMHNPKVKERMLKNYALDRARYFLPLACQTNIAIISTARIWADTIKLVESLQWPEALQLASVLREQLEKVAPNLIRHSKADNASIAFAQELQHVGQREASVGCLWATLRTSCDCRLEVFDPKPSFNKIGTISSALETRGSRYHHTGVALKRQVVQMEWEQIALAELRDLNRHRTGYRFSDFAPKGFYLPEESQNILRQGEKLSKFQRSYETLVQNLARKAQPGLHAYGFFLGSQVSFEHTQQADKFLYEVELRTGLGAHFRYAEHLKQAAEIYFEKFPETRRSIQIGDYEPE